MIINLVGQISALHEAEIVGLEKQLRDALAYIDLEKSDHEAEVAKLKGKCDSCADGFISTHGEVVAHYEAEMNQLRLDKEALESIRQEYFKEIKRLKAEKKKMVSEIEEHNFILYGSSKDNFGFKHEDWQDFKRRYGVEK